MKNRTLLLTFFLISIYWNSKAQTSMMGHEWHYGSSDFWHPYNEGHRFFESLYIIPMRGDTFTRISSRDCLLRDSTAYYYKVDSTKFLLFDTRYNEGDTLAVDAHFSQRWSGLRDTVINLRILITEVYYVKDNALDPNDSLKTFVVRDIDHVCKFLNYDSIGYFTDKIIRKYGPYPLYFNEIFNTTQQDGEGLFLRCFSSNTYNYQTTSTTHECDYSNVGISELMAIRTLVIVYPNPSSGKFVIETAADPINKIMIHDIHGRLVKNVELSVSVPSLEIETSGIAAGIYQAIIITDQGSFARKIVITD